MEDSSDNWERELAEREQKRITEVHANAAFRDAVSVAQESVLQDSFGDGFRRGADLGFVWGQLHGTASALFEVVMAKSLKPVATEIKSILAQLEKISPDAEEAQSEAGIALFNSFRARLDALSAECAKAK